MLLQSTASVSGGQGASGDKSLRAEKTGNQTKAYKSRRVPAVRCTPCWAVFWQEDSQGCHASDCQG